MLKKRKKAAVRAIFLYLLLTGGAWIFLNCYTNSYNRIAGEKLAPASLDASGGKARVTVLEETVEIDVSAVGGESDLYLAAYLLAPDEARSASYLISLWGDV